MYNEKLEELIDAALADGVLTEKEKQVLFKKAQEMGIDLDEFEMVLDSRLVKIKKSEEEKAQSSAPKSNKLGDVKKCPACGAIVQSYLGSCPECGYAFENIGANSSAQELARKCEEIKKEEARKSANESLERQYEISYAFKKTIVATIKNFPVPNTKADLFEFITTMHSKAEDRSEDIEIRKAYSLKYVECIVKAKLLFSNDPLLAKLITEYDNNLAKKKKRIKYTIIISAAVLILITAFCIVFFKNSAKSPEEKLANLIENCEMDEAEDFYHKELLYTSSTANTMMYNGYIENGLYDDAEEFVSKEPDNYYNYMVDVITKLVANNQKDEAMQFIANKINFFYQYDPETYNTHVMKQMKSELEAMVNNL